MKCLKCGSDIPDSNQLCELCEIPIIPIIETEDPITSVYQKKKKEKHIILSICIASILLALILFTMIVSPTISQIRLQRKLSAGWWRLDELNGNIIMYSLEFADKEINIYAQSLEFEKISVATLKYDVIADNKINIQDYNFAVTIEFDDENWAMVISPGLTSSSAQEIWCSNLKPAT